MRAEHLAGHHYSLPIHSPVISLDDPERQPGPHYQRNLQLFEFDRGRIVLVKPLASPFAHARAPLAQSFRSKAKAISIRKLTLNPMASRTMDCQTLRFASRSWNHSNIDCVVLPWHHRQRVELHRRHLFRQPTSCETKLRSGLKVRFRKCLAWPGTNLSQ